MDVHQYLGALRHGLDAALPDALLPADAGLLLIVGGVLGLTVGLLVAFFSKAFDNRGRKTDDTESLVSAEAPEAEHDAPGTDSVAPASSADEVGVALAALPTATADEQRAGGIALEIEKAQLAAVERPIVIRPDPPKPASRFAPDPAIFTPVVSGTVVDTVSVRRKKDAKEAATIPPPIRRILPAPVPADLTPTRDPEPSAAAGSLLGEIGGLPRVEVRAARRAAVTDSVPTPERRARESYELRARELERVAHERLMREQQRLAVSIREQLAHDKRELEAVLDNRIEDTVLRPIKLPARRTVEPRSPEPRERERESDSQRERENERERKTR